jgi:CubicO group peptidase (beta-lactamase class C family)
MRKRLVILGVLAAATFAAQAHAQAGPSFRADGPEAEAYGMAKGYPMCSGLQYVNDLGCRVGAFSNYGKLFPSRVIRAPAQPSPLKRAPQELALTYTHEGKTRTIDDYLNTWPVTGLLIAKDETILVERYQYGRTDKDLLTSFSMAKSMLSLLIGHALERGAIRSLDDTADAYVPELKGTEYGMTPIKALLQMASGVEFSELYNVPSSDIYTLARLTLEQDPVGAIEAVKHFNKRLYPPGKQFHYSSAESMVLGLVLTRAIKRPIADFTSEVLWQPLGAEADANWNVDAKGQEVTYAYYNARLRDWARVGLMMAHGGKWAGRQVVPESWVTAATAVTPESPSPTYGYHIWISRLDRRGFYFSGLRGQFVFVHPRLKLVLVQTSLASNDHQTAELAALYRAAWPLVE